MSTSTGHVKHLGTEDFDAVVAAATGPVLVDFWAEWCGPCRALGPTIEALADRHAESGAVVAKVDVDAAQELAVRFGIASIPTVIVLKGGAEVERFVGIRPAEDYDAALAKHA